MKYLLIFLIRAYQHTLSPDHGPLRFLSPYGVCKFRPTCSEYGVLALEKFSLIRAFFLILRRLLRCHPWAIGGEDFPK